jgi:hypothetical protein
MTFPRSDAEADFIFEVIANVEKGHRLLKIFSSRAFPIAGRLRENFSEREQRLR